VHTSQFGDRLRNSDEQNHEDRSHPDSEFRCLSPNCPQLRLEILDAITLAVPISLLL